MPNITTIQEVLKMAEDLPILQFKGTFKNIYKPRVNKAGAAKAYHYQDTIVTDKSGQEIKLTISDHAEIPQSEIGKTFFFSCTKSDKHGWIGVKTKDNEYDGKITRLIMVTKTGLIESADAPGAENTQQAPQQTAQRPQDRAAGPPPQQPAQTQNAPQAPAQAAKQPTNKQAEELEAVSKAKHFLARRASYLLLCLDAAQFIGDEYTRRNPNHMLSDSQFQAITSTLFIAGDRVGLPVELPLILPEKK